MAPERAPHEPVLLREAIEWLALRPDGVYIDGTAGAGGHSEAIAKSLGSTGRLFSLDRDPTAIDLVSERLRPWSQAQVVSANYGELSEVLRDHKVESVDGVLIDAGVSSMQIDTADRGFSFQEDGPLDMRMNPEGDTRASEYLASLDEDELAKALREYGDVGPAKRIARRMLERVRAGTLSRTGDLVDAVSEALDFVEGTPNEVRTVFQAVRIAVNDEYRWLEAGLRAAIEVLGVGGRLVVIAFHSGEDRVAKNIIRDASRKQRTFLPDGRTAETRPAVMKNLTPKPICPGEDEVRKNPRAKSARMRVAEKLPTA